MEIITNKNLHKFIIFPFLGWGFLFGILYFIVTPAAIPYIGLVWGGVGAIIVIFGLIKGGLLKKGPGIIVYRLFFTASVCFLIVMIYILFLLYFSNLFQE